MRLQSEWFIWGHPWEEQFIGIVIEQKKYYNEKCISCSRHYCSPLQLHKAPQSSTSAQGTYLPRSTIIVHRIVAVIVRALLLFTY